MTTDRSVAVIGAGVVGACVGYYLSRAGAAVVFVDAGQPGELTSAASLAWVNASAKTSDPPYFDLNFAGCREYEQLTGELADTTWWNPTGHLRWDYPNEQDLLSAVDEVRACGYAAEVLDTGSAQELEPQVVFPSTSALVASFPSEAWVDGPKLARALVDSAVRLGAATAFGRPLRRINVGDLGVESIELDDRTLIRVDAVVNAAGPRAPEVAELVGRALPIKRVPGLAVRVQTSEDLVRRVIHPKGAAIRPDGPGRTFLLARSVERSLTNGSTDPIMLAGEVKQCAARAIPLVDGASVIDSRVAYRPVPFDGRPLIGSVTGVEGYYEAVTHSGITLGPIIGRTLTTEIASGEIDALIAPFRATRSAPA